MYGQPHIRQHVQLKVYFIEYYVTMLSEDADRLFEELVKKLVDEVISGYTVSTSPRSSLPAFSHSATGQV
jgi:hypothetical protein